MIVVDVNIVTYALMGAGHYEETMRLWERDNDWRMPELWKHEFQNVLVTSMRAGHITLDGARLLMNQALRLFTPAQCRVGLTEALKISHSYGVTGYDGQYLGLALALRVPLISEDRRLRMAAPDRVWSMEQYLDG